MDRVEKAARALDDAIDNALIAWGMGWDMDGVMACLKEAKDAAALSAAHAEPVAWEHFCDESYFDMWCVRPTGERAFGVGFHVSSEAEAIALVETLAGNASQVPAAVEEAVKALRMVSDTGHHIGNNQYAIPQSTMQAVDAAIKRSQ